MLPIIGAPCRGGDSNQSRSAEPVRTRIDRVGRQVELVPPHRLRLRRDPAPSGLDCFVVLNAGQGTRSATRPIAPIPPPTTGPHRVGPSTGWTCAELPNRAWRRRLVLRCQQDWGVARPLGGRRFLKKSDSKVSGECYVCVSGRRHGPHGGLPNEQFASSWPRP
jgi:hypothetical protein